MFVLITDLKAEDICYSKDDETATLVFSSDLPVGNGNLHIDFTGELNDKMKGFYRSKYLDNGQEKYCAVTQFEVNHATDAEIFSPSKGNLYSHKQCSK